MKWRTIFKKDVDIAMQLPSILQSNVTSLIDTAFVLTGDEKLGIWIEDTHSINFIRLDREGRKINFAFSLTDAIGFIILHQGNAIVKIPCLVEDKPYFFDDFLKSIKLSS